MNQTTFLFLLIVIFILFFLIRQNCRESFAEQNPTQEVALYFNNYVSIKDQENVRYHLCLKMKNAQLKRPFNRIEYKQAKEACQRFARIL